MFRFISATAPPWQVPTHACGMGVEIHHYPTPPPPSTVAGAATNEPGDQWTHCSAPTACPWISERSTAVRRRCLGPRPPITGRLSGEKNKLPPASQSCRLQRQVWLWTHNTTPHNDGKTPSMMTCGPPQTSDRWSGPVRLLVEALVELNWGFDYGLLARSWLILPVFPGVNIYSMGVLPQSHCLLLL